MHFHLFSFAAVVAAAFTDDDVMRLRITTPAAPVIVHSTPPSHIHSNIEALSIQFARFRVAGVLLATATAGGGLLPAVTAADSAGVCATSALESPDDDS